MQKYQTLPFMIGEAIRAVVIAVFIVIRVDSPPKEMISTQPVPVKGIDVGIKQ